MNDPHFRNLDLNLLRVFEALLVEGSATRAGARLGLSQSAISHSLGRLRRSLDDDLFVRGPAGLQPTSRALDLAPAVQKALKLLEAAVSAPRFDPAVTERRFDVCATAYICAVLMPRLVRRFFEAAPRAKLRIHGQDAAFADDLSRGRVDAVVGGFEQVPDGMTYTHLFEETGVLAVRAGHPAIADGAALAKLAGLHQVMVRHSDEMEPERRGQRPNLGLKRLSTWSEDYIFDGHTRADAISLSVPDSFSTLAIVSQTDMVALLPRRLAESASAKRKLALIDPPNPPPPAKVGVVTRASESAHGPVAWPAGLMQAAAAGL